MPKVDFIATWPHWLEHLAPVWKALDDSERGRFYISAPSARFHEDILRLAALEQVDVTPMPKWPKMAQTVVVAGEADRRPARGHRIIRFEHGVGFSFHGRNKAYRQTVSREVPGLYRFHELQQPNRAPTSYAGGAHQTNVVAFINPNHYADDAWRAAYPNTPTHIVGMPKMDRWHDAPTKERSDPPVVALTWHWNATVAPETRSAYSHYKTALPLIGRARRFKAIAHAHPRYGLMLKRDFDKAGIEWVSDLAEVYERADVLVNDSSSVLYEFASLDRPVVVLNAPWFRRNVHHGLRFWEHSEIGVVVNQPQDLKAGIVDALTDTIERQRARKLATEEVFPYRGDASARAADAIREHL